MDLEWRVEHFIVYGFRVVTCRVSTLHVKGLGIEDFTVGIWSQDASFPVFSVGGHCEQFWHGQGCPLFEVVHPAFPLPTTMAPTLQCAMEKSFGEAVVVCDVPVPSLF